MSGKLAICVLRRQVRFALAPRAGFLHTTCMKELQDRVAIITGGARGIGRAVAERLLSLGARVSLWDRDAECLAATATAIGAHHRVLDITDAAAVDAAAAGTRAHFGRVDILVNNAGI